MLEGGGAKRVRKIIQNRGGGGVIIPVKYIPLNKGKEAETERERPPSRGVKRKLRSPTQQSPVEMKTRVVKVTSSGNVTKTVTAAPKTVTAAPKTVNAAAKTAATVTKTSNGASVTSSSALIKDSEAPLTKLRSPIKQEPLLILGARYCYCTSLFFIQPCSFSLFLKFSPSPIHSLFPYLFVLSCL